MTIGTSHTAMATDDENTGQPIEGTAAVVVVVVADRATATTDGEGGKTAGEFKQPPIKVYNPRKPKWWNRLGNNGRDATKSQKRAIRRVLDGAEAEGTTNNNTNDDNENFPRGSGIRLPPVPYGSKMKWDEIFPYSSEECRDIWLELGFGRGENLQALLESKIAREKKNERHFQNSIGGGDGSHTPNSDPTHTKKFYLVGAEVSGVGIGCICKRIQKIQQLQQLQGSDGCDDDPGYILYRPDKDPYSSNAQGDDAKDPVHGERVGSTNDTKHDCETRRIERDSLGSVYQDRLRIHAGDGYKLLPKIPDGSLSAILITFPDPFPKDSDVNYRLVQHQTLIECHRILRKGHSANGRDGSESGRLFLATDHDGYHEWCYRMLYEVNNNYNTNNHHDGPSSPSLLFELEENCPDRMEWLPAVSRYEQKGWDEGRSTKLSCWIAI